MSSAEVNKRLVTRKIIAVAFLCLFASRGLGFLGVAASPAAAMGLGDLNSSQLAVGAHCYSGKNDANPPSQDRDHSGCCVLCMSAARDAAVLSVLIVAEVIVLSPIETNGRSKFAIENRAPTKLPGLRSSWSATSPPMLV
jgi:hypothetical protein